MKRLILLAFVLALPGLAQAWNGGRNYGPTPDRNTRNMMMLQEMQHRAHDQEQEWRRRDDEQRRRVEEDRQREQWRRDEERRRTNARQQEERTRDWEQRRTYEERRQERFQHELLHRDEQKRQGGKGGAYREPEYRGKPLNPKELRRYELIKPGERP